MITIRPMTHADVAAVKVIEDELFPIDAWSKELFLEELAQSLTSREVAVAVQDDEIVGYASFRYVGKQGDVNTVAVAKQFQGQGIGTILMDWLESHASCPGIDDGGRCICKKSGH
mgnify:CR=1 FL=1